MRSMLLCATAMLSLATIGCGGTRSCTPETDAAFCSRQPKDCGSFSGVDNCGTARADVDCGTCATTGQECGGGGVPNVCGTPGTVSGTPLLGINTLWANSWYPVVPFANVFASARKPATLSSWNTPAAVDADGNPTADFRIVIYEGALMSDFSGTYKLRFRGQADVTAFNMTISGKAYDGNITTADVAIDASGNAGMYFANTRRNPGDAAGTGLTELSLMYPGTSYDTDVLTPHFLTAITPFGVLRPMQAQNPKNPIHTWSKRTRPRGLAAAHEQFGMAFEYVVLMANAASRDIWLNVPYYFDTDGEKKLAQLFEYGSDGDLPYTGPFGSTYDATNNPRPAPHDPSTWTPAVTEWYPPLRQGLHVYVELSNELWNTGSNDYWGVQIAQDAQAEYDAGDAYHYGILGGSNVGYLRLGRHGRLHKELAENFLAVVGEANYGDRYRMVLASQIDWDDVLRGPMTYISTVYGGHQNDGAKLGALVTTEDGRQNAYGNPAWPITRYVHYLSGAPYISGATTADQAKELEDNIKGPIARLKQYADLYGVKMIAYEGGAEGGPGYLDPGSTQVILDLLHYWYSLDPEAPFVYFGIAENQGYGLSPSIFDIDPSLWPKWKAIDQIAAELSQ